MQSPNFVTRRNSSKEDGEDQNRTTRRGVAAASVALLALGAGMIAPLSLGTGCLSSSITVVASGEGGSNTGEGGAVTVEGDDPSANEQNKDAITYRDDLSAHPGCTTDGLDTRAAGCPKTAAAYSGDSIASIPGYKCAAKVYPGGTEDKSKPIVILVHGNSDAPSGWEKFPVDTGAPQLAETLTAQGFKVIASDVRFDKVPDPTTNNDTENAGQNFDHGWAVPIVQNLVDSVMTAYPDRQISMVGFSLGPTVIRDALRRLHRAKKKPFEHIKDLVFGAGSHHGVSTYRKLCGPNPTMRGLVACQLGDRTAYQPTDFLTPLNGPDGAFETPCRDGDVAFGQKGVCGGHKVRYMTIVMQDHEDGKLEDEFVSQSSSKLNGADNQTVPIASIDTSGYFCTGTNNLGIFKNHYGAVRSDAALTAIMKALSAP